MECLRKAAGFHKGDLTGAAAPAVCGGWPVVPSAAAIEPSFFIDRGDLSGRPRNGRGDVPVGRSIVEQRGLRSARIPRRAGQIGDARHLGDQIGSGGEGGQGHPVGLGRVVARDRFARLPVTEQGDEDVMGA